MSLSRSTFYDAPPVTMAPSEVLIRISAICDEFECYGYRRVGAALRHQGVIVNSKKLRRLMRENDLQPKRRRRYVVTTGRGPDLCRHPGRLRLSRRHRRCVVTKGGWLCD